MSQENTRNAAGQGPAPFMDKHHEELYLEAMKNAVAAIDAAMEKLMGNTYYQLFRTPPEELQRFLLLLLRTDPPINGKRCSILNRDSFLKKCSRETQDAAGRARRESGRKKKIKTDALDNEIFDGLVRRELERLKKLAETDPDQANENIRRFFGCMDLPVCCKVNVKHIAKRDDSINSMDSLEVYNALRKKGLLKGVDENDWSRLCDHAITLRNTYTHGGVDGARKVWDDGGPELALADWYRIAELLYCKDLNQEEYDSLQEQRRAAQNIQNSRVFFFRDLLPDIKVPGVDEADLYRHAISRHIPRDRECVLYCGTREELARELEQEHRAKIEIPVEELREAVGDDIDLEALLAGMDYHIRGGKVLGRSRDEVLTVLRMEQDRRKQAAENQALAEENQELRQSAEADRNLRLLTPEQRKNLCGSDDLKRMAEEKLNRLPRLWELEDLQKDPLSSRQLDELVRTHRLVLDASLLRSPVGRDFIQKKLVPRVKKERVPLEVEVTARYHIMRDFAAYREAKYEYNRTDWNARPPEERRAAERRLQTLREAANAYILLHDALRELRETKLLRWTDGIPDPDRRDEDMLLRLLEDQYAGRRVCVLTCGVTPLTKRITRDLFPLCVVARVQDGYFFPETGERRDGPACLIFSQYLPLEAGGGAGEAQVPLQPSAQAESTGFPLTAKPWEMDGSLLPRTIEPKAGDLLYTRSDFTEKDAPVQLVGVPLAAGGEGILYRVRLENMVAKLYHPDKLTVGRKQKLEYMVAHNPRIRNVCWPTHLLYNEAREFVGFLMPRAPRDAYPFQRSVLQLDKPSVQKVTLPGWGRLDLARTARAVAQLAAALHEKNVLIGDVNDNNFMVDPEDSSAVCLVDCDSFQVGGYPCPVGVEEYTHPEVIDLQEAAGGSVLREEWQEDYSLAILIFRILTLGREPFDTSGDLLRAMREKRFLSEENSTQSDKLIRKNIPWKMEEGFKNAFAGWAPPAASDWVKMLDTYVEGIQSKYYSPELVPITFPDKDGYSTYLNCECCGKRFNMGPDAYKKSKKWDKLILCPHCTVKRDQFSRSSSLVKAHPKSLVCDRCGRQFPDPEEGADKDMHDDRFFIFKVRGKVTCPKCSPDTKWISARCEICGKNFGEQEEFYNRHRRKGLPYVCWDCRRKMDGKGIDLVCCRCGNRLHVSGKWDRVLPRYYKQGEWFCSKEHMDGSPQAG